MAEAHSSPETLGHLSPRFTGTRPAAGSPYRQAHDYTHDAYGKAREAEVAATLSMVRARLRGAQAPVRCGDCGYLTTAPGHLAECGGGDG